LNTACPSYIAPSFDADTGTASREDRGDFADEFNFYKMVWIFIIGSVAGFMVETLWCLIRCGHFESRTSLIFVPFTVIYGIGAAVMYVTLHKIERDQKFNIFFIGALAGTGIEFVGSYAQEMMFGSVS